MEDPRLTKEEIEDYVREVKKILERDVVIYDIKEIERLSAAMQFSLSLQHII